MNNMMILHKSYLEMYSSKISTTLSALQYHKFNKSAKNHNSHINPHVQLILTWSHKTMCWNARIVYGCTHFGWSAQVKACKIQHNFDSGTSPVACHTRWSHPIHTHKVGRACPSCECKAQFVDGRLNKIKEVLGSLNSTMERIRGGPARNPVSGVPEIGWSSKQDLDSGEEICSRNSEGGRYSEKS
ncbi:hypothetical protein BJ878DRAFT_499091 [Calycina marina]|uniref:Uncharacterized protein n=1 Tax=Calycina marina TaxID=1763456 RepID=A0A9P8CGQ3_9HELO|nr:hypothetical protein BJ878DRAFT_499091 [Calycina marina]